MFILNLIYWQPARVRVGGDWDFRLASLTKLDSGNFVTSKTKGAEVLV